MCGPFAFLEPAMLQRELQEKHGDDLDEILDGFEQWFLRELAGPKD